MASSKTKTIRVAVMGSGEAPGKKVLASLRDFIGGLKGDVTFQIPMMKDEWNDGMAFVVDYLIENDIAYDVLVNLDDKKTRAFKPYLQNASEVMDRQRGLLQGLVRRLAEADESHFLALYDEDDRALGLVLDKALEAGVQCHDLADGLSELGPDEEASADEEDDEEEEPEEESDDDDSEDEEQADEDSEEEEEAPVARKARGAKKTTGSLKEPSAIATDDLVRQVIQEIAKRLTTV